MKNFDKFKTEIIKCETAHQVADEINNIWDKACEIVDVCTADGDRPLCENCIAKFLDSEVTEDEQK